MEGGSEYVEHADGPENVIILTYNLKVPNEEPTRFNLHTSN